MNTAGELALGCLAITVGWGVVRAVDAWWHQHQLAERDWGLEMQVAAERHLEACNDALWLEEDGVHGDSPAAAPFCGCGTCLVREVLVAAWPVMQDMVLDVSHRSDITFELRMGETRE